MPRIPNLVTRENYKINAQNRLIAFQWAKLANDKQVDQAEKKRMEAGSSWRRKTDTIVVPKCCLPLHIFFPSQQFLGPVTMHLHNHSLIMSKANIYSFGLLIIQVFILSL